MNANRNTAVIVGALFLTVNITFILGAAVFIEPILSAPDYLTLVSANKTQVILGVLFELMNGIAYMAIAVLMFPILRQHFEGLALGYVGFRIVEFVMQILSDISPLSLLTVSEEFISAGTSESMSFQTSGILLLAERQSAFLMVSLTFGLGALMFYYILYQSKLIPRFISIWGLIGATAVLINTLLDMFGLSSPNLGILMLLNELFLGVWLIIKGFDSSAIVSSSSQ
jgi:hypothetical protein